MIRRFGTVVWSALGAFHLWLFATQAWAGRMDSAESARWLLAVLLAGGLVALKRQGGSLLRDRRATALWVLVALLHGPTLAEDARVAGQVLAEVPAVTSSLATAAMGLGLTLAVALARRLRPTPPVQPALAVAYHAPALRALVGCRSVHAPRPPPAF